jgi:sterol desaturase/sphingolipid hydroxylase (fatty acid hydroxylase superfamily)
MNPATDSRAAKRSLTLRDRAAYLTFPLLMGGFVAVAAWGLAGGISPGAWGAALTVVNFFVILAFEQVLPRNAQMNVFRDRQSFNDVGHGILLASVARPLGSVLAVWMLAGAAELRASLGAGALWPETWSFALQMVPALVIWTFSDYWVHRALHTFDRLWWFHAIHHDTPQMHILKSGRLHFFEELPNALLKPIPLLLLGAPPEIMVLVGLWIVFDGNLAHSNIDQRFPSWAHYLLPTVQLHNLHHAQRRRHQDSNYSGSTAIWDVLFGTFSHPEENPLGELGIEHSPVPSGFLEQLAFPFRAQRTSPTAGAAVAREPFINHHQ